MESGFEGDVWVECLWRAKLDSESSLLTTFETPFGRFRWLRLAMGLSVSSEIFAARIQAALTRLKGVYCIADDILITTAPVLGYYSPHDEVTVQCDSSSYAISAVMLQNGKVIEYASRAMTEAEICLLYTSPSPRD